MSLNNNTVDFTKIDAFCHMGNDYLLCSIKAVARSSPGIGNYYLKFLYNDISNYYNRKNKFLEISRDGTQFTIVT